MSPHSSDDELEMLDTAPPKRASSRGPRSKAGPSVTKSSKQSKARSKRPPSPSGSSDVVEIQRNVHSRDSNTPAAEGPPPPKRPAKQPTRGKGKGKGKAAPSNHVVIPDIDIQTQDESEEEQQPNDSRTNGHTNNAPPRISQNDYDSLRRQNDVLKRKIAALEGHIARLTGQCERYDEVVNQSTRHMEDLKQTHKAEIESLHHVIDNLKSMTGPLEEFVRPGDTSIANFLTRKAANKEQEALDAELTRCKRALAEKNNALAEEHKKFKDLEDKEKYVRLELSHALEQNKTLKGSRVGTKAAIDDPKHSVVVNFYEDITNLLVLDIKPQPPQYMKLTEWTLSCLYSWTSVDAGEGQEKPSISFSLRLCWAVAEGEEEPITREEQLVPSIQYTPTSLEQESEAFRESLKFLSGSFTFTRNQLPLFLRTLRDTLAPDDDDDDEVQGEEGDEMHTGGS